MVLIDFALGKQVVFGGGRINFLPNDTKDPQTNMSGGRVDNRNLIDEWHDIMSRQKNKRFKYIWNASEFRKTDFKSYDHVLGLLAYNHMKFENVRNPLSEPSISEVINQIAFLIICFLTRIL